MATGYPRQAATAKKPCKPLKRPYMPGGACFYLVKRQAPGSVCFFSGISKKSEKNFFQVGPAGYTGKE